MEFLQRVYSVANMWWLMLCCLCIIEATQLSRGSHSQPFTRPAPLHLARDPCQDCSCGERNEEPRVVGGLGSKVNAFPWLARLIYQKSFGCGASLINDRYVVTAAHCMKGFMWFMFRVTFGEHDRCDKSHPPVQRYVVKVVAHDFNIKVLSNDIALLRLSSSLEYSHAIRPVCLPTNEIPQTALQIGAITSVILNETAYPVKKTANRLYVGTKAIVAGWGATGEGNKWSCQLLEAELPVLSNEHCRATKYNASKIQEVMMCAGYPETAHIDACTGDSGGPLITENEDRTYDLIGIVSWGYGCARKGYPGVYTRVTNYLDWIRDNTEDACYCNS